MATFQITKSLQDGVDKIFGFLPHLVGAIVLLILGYIVAKIIQSVIQTLLRRVRFDRALHVSVAGKYISRFVESPTKVVGKIAYWVIFLVFVSFALEAFSSPVVNNIINGIYAYIPKVVAAILIFLVASAITGGAEAFIRKVLGSTPLAKLVGAVLPAITMSIAVFMILNELQIAKDIVNITYAAIMGALSLGLALAFGLGGRDVAARMLEQAYSATQANADTIKQQARSAAANTRNAAQSAKDKLE